MRRTHDAIVILGGGRHPDGRLTALTTQRLNKGTALFHMGRAPTVLVMSGHYATWSPKAIRFPDVQAILAKNYLVSHGVADSAIVAIPDDTVRDTITEALVARRVARTHTWHSVLLVTSDKHMARALMVFRRMLGDTVSVDAADAPCGDLLNAEREALYRTIVSRYLALLPDDPPDPPDWESWFHAHQDLYARYAIVDSQFRVDGKELSQAYAAAVDD